MNKVSSIVAFPLTVTDIGAFARSAPNNENNSAAKENGNNEWLIWVASRRWAATGEFERLNGENRPLPVIAPSPANGCLILILLKNSGR